MTYRYTSIRHLTKLNTRHAVHSTLKFKPSGMHDRVFSACGQDKDGPKITQCISYIFLYMYGTCVRYLVHLTHCIYCNRRRVAESRQCTGPVIIKRGGVLLEYSIRALGMNRPSLAWPWAELGKASFESAKALKHYC